MKKEKIIALMLAANTFLSCSCSKDKNNEVRNDEVVNLPVVNIINSVPNDISADEQIEHFMIDMHSGETKNELLSIDQIVCEVIAGKWGTGQERQVALVNAGYDYDQIQNRVNEILNGASYTKPEYIYDGVFGFANEDTILYDVNGNIISNINKYQKLILCNDKNSDFRHVVVPNIAEGYINSSVITDLPNTFVEVNITEQKLYMYYNGELVLTSDVITGNPNIGTIPGTDVGYTEVLSKEYETELEGPTWKDCYVDIYIKFNCSGEGFHDADGWRKDYEYGNPKYYITNGSHGCVNMKQQDVEILDQYTQVGTKVLIYKNK